MWDYFKIKCLFVTTQEIEWRSAFIVTAAGYNLWLLECASPVGAPLLFSSHFSRSLFALKPKVGLNWIKADTGCIACEFIFFLFLSASRKVVYTLEKLLVESRLNSLLLKIKFVSILVIPHLVKMEKVYFSLNGSYYFSSC